MNRTLREVAKYSKERVLLEDLDLSTYVTTDNLLQNKEGKVEATNLPPNGKTVTKFSNNDILVANIRPYLKKIWLANHEGGSSSDILTLRVNHKYNPSFIYYALFRDIFFEHMMNGSKGTKMPRGDKNQILDFPIPDFEKSKQDRIAKVLSDFDKKIELNKKINNELESIAKLIYDYWFVQFDFPDENGKPYKSSGGEMVFSEELNREIPKGWTVEKLVNEMDVQYGYPFSTEYFNEDGLGKPVIRIRDILETSISIYSTEEVDKKYELKKGDLVIGMDGNFHMNFWDKSDCYLNQRSVRIGKKPQSSVSNLQAYFDIEPFIKAREENVSRTTVGHLSASDINALNILIPNYEKNNIQFGLFDSILKKIIMYRNQNQELRTLRNWLLPMLMNGQVTVIEAEEEFSIAAEPDTEYKVNKNPTNVDYYRRTVLAAEIVWQLHQQPTLGHVKLQKIIYLAKQTSSMMLPTNFLKQAAGPYDPQMARSIDKQLKKNKWFEFQKDEFLKYKPLEKAGEHKADFNKYFHEEKENIQFFIDTFKKAKTDKVEIIATLYACWKELIEKGKTVTDDVLIEQFYKWSKEKAKFKEERLLKAINWMRDEGVYPVS